MSYYQMLKLWITKSWPLFSNQPNLTSTRARSFHSIKPSIVETKVSSVYYLNMALRTFSAETPLVNLQSITLVSNVTEQSLKCFFLKEQILTCLMEMATLSFITCVKAMWGTLNSRWWDGSLNQKEWDSFVTTSIKRLSHWLSLSHPRRSITEEVLTWGNRQENTLISWSLKVLTWRMERRTMKFIFLLFEVRTILGRYWIWMTR